MGGRRSERDAWAGVGGAATWARLFCRDRRLLPTASVYGAFMDSGFCEVGAEQARDVSMAASLEVMHPLDPPPPDVLLALLARNKALEEAFRGCAMTSTYYETRPEKRQTC
ncbi:unnamed protein product [Pieris brassicae]|uniref:Uncharacterized protein n=1 Tax=Pieris brassicae TaxID=7116 RepID=A0A9P0X6Z3_PIEBR|nr:unnamed protein product [Pieris brassicae]